MPRIERNRTAGEPAEDLERPSVLSQPVSVNEVAESLKVSGDTVREMFLSEPGVLFVGGPKGKVRKRRTYRSMRIPESVLARVIRRISQSA